MLLQIDKDHAALTWVAPDDGGLRLLDRYGNIAIREIGDRTGSLKLDDQGKLILRSKLGAALIDTASDFEVSEFRPAAGNVDQPCWSAAFLNLLVDGANRVSSEYPIDRDALALEDPGYTEPTDATLLPNGEEVAITIVRSQHIAIVNFLSGKTRLLQLAGSYGNSHAIVEEHALWVANYDTLCRIDLETLRVSHSPKLQPAFRDPQHGRMSSAFIGVPTLSGSADGWLVPRPYSGDILLVSKTTLLPERRIACGGRPYALVEFSNGDLLILDHPFNAFQTASVSQLVAL